MSLLLRREILTMAEYKNKHDKVLVKNPITDYQTQDILNRSESWRAIANQFDKYEENGKISSRQFIFSGKVLQGGNFSGENLENADFSGSNMQEINLSKANLKNVDFTGADLSGADLSEANLDGAIFTGAKLIGTNFTGAHMHGVKLINADLQDAILLDADLDNLTIEELQELIEYLALYYPHKLNLSRINLTLLDLSRIDLRNVNLRGVDFTGCNFFGVNIYELDLSECIISPAQIEQAIGHFPTPEELKKLLAPKKKKNKRKIKGIDFSSFFNGRGGFDWDTTKGGVSFKDILKFGKDLKDSFKKPDSDEKIIENFDKNRENKKDDRESSNDELRKSIEQYKQEVLEQRREQKYKEDRYIEIDRMHERIQEVKMIVKTQKGNER